jgi:hypothetical protein
MSDRAKPKPSYTDAMGLNNTAASITGWKQLILKEELAREEWRRRYASSVGDAELQVADRVKNHTGVIIPRTLDETVKLQDGISKEGKGRSAYLKDRATLPPQDRYRRPVTSSQTVGWKCTQLPPINEDQQHYGRKPIIENNFYRKVGGKVGMFSGGNHAGQPGLNMLS